MRASFTALILVVLVGCGEQRGGTDAGARFQGVWIQKDEAIELRSTGRIDSLCVEKRHDPNATIINVRKIKPDGVTYVYDPVIGTVPQMQIGTVFADGKFAISGAWAQNMKGITIAVSRTGDTLAFTYARTQWSSSVEYLLSSEEETVRYFQAESACK